MIEIRSLDLKFVFAIILLTILQGCGTENMSLNPNSAKFLHTGSPGAPSRIVDDSIGFLISEFVNDAASYGLNTSKDPKDIVRFMFFDGLVDGKTPPFVINGIDKDGKAILGVCSLLEENNHINKKHLALYYVIYFDSSYRDKVNTFKFKALAYHELAHCFLEAPHSEPAQSKSRYVENHIKEYLADKKENGEIEGLLSQDVKKAVFPEGGFKWLQGYYYPANLLNSLTAKYENEYDAIAVDNIKIMDPSLEGDEDFWSRHWPEAMKKMFLSLGGHE